jgi:hypothetical protein
MKGERSAVLAALWLLVAYGAACAADPGDPLKGTGGAKLSPFLEASIGNDASLYGEGSTQDDAGGSPVVDSPSGDDGSVPDAVVATDSSGGGPPMDAPVIMDSPPPVDVGIGAGCAAGSTVITLTFPTMPPGYSTNTMNFGTLGAVCVQLKASVHQGWGISNGQGRMVTVTDASGTHGPVAANGTLFPPLPTAPQAGSDGFVYWNFTAEPPATMGGITYTSLYTF